MTLEDRVERLENLIDNTSSIRVFVEKVNNDSKLPFYAHNTDAGLDLYANKDYLLLEGETKIISTGIKLAIPEGFEVQIRPRSGLSAHTYLRMPNSPGTIDAGYRDEVGVILSTDPGFISNDKFMNYSNQNLLVNSCGRPATIVDLDGKLVHDNLEKIYINRFFASKNYSYDDFIHDINSGKFCNSILIRKGDRIAQMVLCKIYKVAFEEVTDVTKIGENRNSGFGGTGVR